MAVELGGGVAAVVQQEGDRVLVSVPMVGFPPGFRLTPGDRVVLVSEASGAAARPLVVAHRLPGADAEKLESGAVEVGGRRLTLQAASIRGEATPGEPGEHIAWVVERGAAEGPSQVVAIRPARVRRQG